MELQNDKLLGVEAVWNHHNYWASVQESDFAKVNWNLRDQSAWEPLVAMGRKFENSTQNDNVILEEDEEETVGEIEPDLPHKLPASWCKHVEISHTDFETRAPEGKRTKVYKRAMFEYFSPYVQQDGLVLRKSYFKDLALSLNLREELIYENREDMLLNRKVDLIERKVDENFSTGREDCLKKHTCTLDEENRAETDRTFEFYGDNRADGLYKLVETPTSIVEHFKGLLGNCINRSILFQIVMISCTTVK